MCDLCPPSGLPWDHPDAKPLDDVQRVINHHGLPPLQPYQEDIVKAVAKGEKIELRRGRKW